MLDIATMEKEKQKELIYDSDQSENTFSIPVKTLKKFSNGERPRRKCFTFTIFNVRR